MTVFFPYLFSRQIASFLCCIIVSPVACLAPPYFFTLSHKWHDLKKKKLSNIKWVFWFSLHLSEKCIILRWIQWDAININKSTCMTCIILVRFNETWILSFKTFKQSSNIKFNENVSKSSQLTNLFTMGFRNSNRNQHGKKQVEHNKISRERTVFTPMQDKVFSLNLALKYVRSF